MPVETRRCSVCSTSFSAVIFGGSIFPAQPARREAGALAAAALSSTISDNEFQALHSVHCPCHLLNSAPHSLQT